MSTRIHIVVSDELLGRMDAVRGDVPRSVWIRRLIERATTTRGGRPITAELIERTQAEAERGYDVLPKIAPRRT